ncbi:MAG: hypothetical protein QXW44_06670 [Pyrobaculum sp.]
MAYENTQEIKIRLRKEEVKALVKWLIENNYDVWEVLDLLIFDIDDSDKLYEQLHSEIKRAIDNVIRRFVAEEIYSFVKENIVIDEEYMWRAVYTIYAFKAISDVSITFDEYRLENRREEIEVLKQACTKGVIKSSCDVILSL